MKTKQNDNRRNRSDRLVRQIVTHFKKKGVRCGYGDEMTKLRTLK